MMRVNFKIAHYLKGNGKSPTKQEVQSGKEKFSHILSEVDKYSLAGMKVYPTKSVKVYFFPHRVVREEGTMLDEITEQTEAVLSHHLQALRAGGEEIMQDYVDESILFTPDGPMIGLIEIYKLYKNIPLAFQKAFASPPGG